MTQITQRSWEKQIKMSPNIAERQKKRADYKEKIKTSCEICLSTLTQSASWLFNIQTQIRPKLDLK